VKLSVGGRTTPRKSSLKTTRVCNN
jgi:hypothetical protein